MMSIHNANLQTKQKNTNNALDVNLQFRSSHLLGWQRQIKPSAITAHLPKPGTRLIEVPQSSSTWPARSLSHSDQVLAGKEGQPFLHSVLSNTLPCYIAPLQRKCLGLFKQNEWLDD